MCTRPDHRSVSSSADALARSCLTVASCLGILFVAIVCAPVRFLRGRHPQQVHAAPVTHVDVQVHLEDAKCVAELKRVIRQTLRRSARTWAPLSLPVDRVVVGTNFPAGGKVDLYATFPHQTPPPAANGEARPFVVVSLGLRDGDRELETTEVAGALAAQVQAVIDDQYSHRTATTSVSFVSTRTAAPPERPSRLTARAAASTADATASVTPSPGVNGAGTGDAGFPRLQDYLVTKQQGQPLEAAGPSSNGTHP